MAVLDIETGAILSLVAPPPLLRSVSIWITRCLDLDYEGIVSQGCVFYNICAGSNIAPGGVFALPARAAAVDVGDRGSLSADDAVTAAGEIINSLL